MTPRETPVDVRAAERAVAAFEMIQEGEPYAESRAAARAALSALRDEAMTRLSRFEPWGADVIADFEFLIQSANRQDVAQLLVGILPQCLDTHPTLVRFLISPPVIELIRSYNVTAGAPDREREMELSYLQAQCANLRGRAEFEPAATILAETSIALAERCRVTEERLEHHVRAERDRAQLEQQETAAVLAADDQRRRDGLREFFANRSSQRFFMRNRIFSGAGLSQSVGGVGLRDQEDGDFVQLPTLEELETVMKRALAAEAVTA